MTTERNSGLTLEVVIVSHGAEALLRRCLRSLAEHPISAGEMRVTVVDSGSPDGTPDMVEVEFPEVRLLRRGNIGFSAANNLVLRQTPAAAVLLLNPDTEVYAGTLDAALARLRSEERIGMVGVKLVTESGELDHACKRSFPTPLSALGHFTGVGGEQYRAAHLGDDEPGEVDAVNGAFMLIRRAALEQVGCFDEGYWMYMEDLDLCYRLREAGWLTWYEPTSVALHVKGGSAGRRSPRLVLAFHAGMSRFYDKHYAPNAAPGIATVVRVGIRARMLLVLIASAPGRAWRWSSWR